jgi:hypothetical protein
MQKGQVLHRSSSHEAPYRSQNQNRQRHRHSYLASTIHPTNSLFFRIQLGQTQHDGYDYIGDVATHYLGNDENSQQSAEELLLSFAN